MTRTFQSALDYAARGWRVIPLHSIDANGCTCGRRDCSSPGKHPRLFNGLKGASADAGTIRGWWDAWPNANIGILTGPESGIIVMDVDDLDARPHGIPETVCQRTGSGGEHYIFMHPGVHVKSRVGVRPGVDSRADGGYIVAPPSSHISGNRYEWIEGPDDVPLAPAPAWWLEECAHVDRPESGPAVYGEEIHEGGRNAALTRVAGTLRRAGLGLDALTVALLEHNKEKCRPPLDEWEVRQIARSVVKYRDEAAVERQLIKDGAELAAALLENHQAKIAERLVSRVTRDAGPPPEFMPKSGLIREIAQHILDQSERPLPLAAVMAATCFVGALAGRKYETPTGLGPNLVAVILAESGGGKDKARKVLKNLAASCGPEVMRRIGAEELASSQGLLAAMHETPSQMFLLDEFGHMLGSINDKNSASHRKDIPQTMMKLYSSYGTVYGGTAYADPKTKPRQIIKSPCMVVYGTTTHETFYRALNSGAGTDGFLARLLCVDEGGDRPALADPPYTRASSLLLDDLRGLDAFQAAQGNLSAYANGDDFAAPMTVRMPKDIRQAFRDFDESMTPLMTDGASRSIYSRVAENAIKLALVYAVAEDYREPVIGHEAWLWGRDIALWCANSMMRMLDDHVADNQVQAWRKRILNAIRAGGKEGVAKWEILRKVNDIRAHERDEVLKDILDAGEAVVRDGKIVAE